MKLRTPFLAVVAGVSLLACLGDAHALTKEARPFDDERADDWAAGASCLVRYYNTCTGWLWVWGTHSEDGDRLGVVASTCCAAGGAGLLQTAVLTYYGAPPGYGFTGTIAAFAVDANDCPSGPALATHPFFPGTGVFVVTNWGGIPVPNRFATVVTVADDLGFANPSGYASDHPAAGPTGPQACGHCFPVTRSTRSFDFGDVALPLCPGERFNDGACDAELIWDFTFVCPTRIEESSWSKIKELYR